MKQLFGRLCILIFLILSVMGSVSAQSGGGYDLSWSTIDGGGGPSSGGSYEGVGTAGQPDAGFMAGGGYEMASGFWQVTTETPTAITLQDYLVRPKSTAAPTMPLLVLAAATTWWILIGRTLKRRLQK